MIYLAIVEDKTNIRNTLENKLNALANCEVLFTAENGQDFLEKMMIARRSIEPNLVLMDIDMPIMDGIEAIKKGKERYPDLKFLILTIFDEDDKIVNAIKAGADGYLLKDEPIDKIQEVIVDLLNNEGTPMSPSIARRVLKLLMNSSITKTSDISLKDDDYKLTGKEKDVLDFLVEGYEYKEIAQKMSVSPHTVRNHIANIYKKLHVTSKTQAIKVYKK
jgi:DNA-binding NarL/FixJ family response regulator